MECRSLLSAGILGLALMGCAHGSTKEAESTEPKQAEYVSAQRMYAVAEGMFSRGDFAGAERMLAHAIVQLPPTAHNDDLRHRLIMRLAHIQMVYADQATAEEPLQRADAMLERYLAKHEALFGEESTPQRDEIYEQLGQVTLAHERLEEKSRAPEGATPAGERFAKVEPVTEVDDVYEGEELDASQGWKRRVRVRRNRYGDHTDAEIQERFDDPHYDPRRGLWMTRPGYSEYSEARALVRLQRDVEPKTRSWATSVVERARPALERCYADAFSRVPVRNQRVEVTFEVREDGSASAPRIAAGGLGDGQGDACVIASLRQASQDVDRGLAVAPVTMRLPLVFMFEDKRWIDEASGEAASPGRFGSSWKEYNPDIVPHRDQAATDTPSRIPLN